MDFQALQTKFEKLNLDNRSIWLWWGSNNKEAINDWYKQVYQKAIQDRSLQQIMKSAKTLITITSKEWTMPTDFLQPVKLYFKVSQDYSEIDKEEFPYRYIRTWWGYKVIFDQTPNHLVYVEYIPQITELLSNTDKITLPAEFDRDIVNYALVEYFRQQRDWLNVTNSLQYAEWKVLETIDQFWLE